jgi:hypothetical protein
LSYWSALVTGILLAAILAITFLICWLAYLVFLLRLVGKTNDSKSLVHAATAIRAFRAGSGGLLSTMTKILKRS